MVSVFPNSRVPGVSGVVTVTVTAHLSDYSSCSASTKSHFHALFFMCGLYDFPFICEQGPLSLLSLQFFKSSQRSGSPCE